MNRSNQLRDQLHQHPLFQRIPASSSGIERFLLTHHIATHQKALYFMVPSLSGEEQWLWFRTATPPSFSFTLAAISLHPDQPRTLSFPGMVLAGNPCLRADGLAAYVPVGHSVYLQPIDGEPTPICTIPSEFLNKRHLFSLVTDLTLSSDGTTLLLDSQIGDRWLIWTHHIPSGKSTPLRWLTRKFHHSAFSLHEPTLLMLNQGNGNNPITGERFDIEQRTWLMNTTNTLFEPLLPDLCFGLNAQNCHEWWTTSGHIQWCDYQQGIWQIHSSTRQRELIWPRPLIHGQASPCERFLVGDEFTYNWNDKKPCSVWIYDRHTKKESPIAQNLPLPPFGWDVWRTWHPDPHPHFSASGSAIIYTTTESGKLSLAIAPTPSEIS